MSLTFRLVSAENAGAEAFQPGKCGQLALPVISAANQTTPESKLIDSKMVQQVWGDFEVYRRRLRFCH
jgi:hypothetical protein